MKSRAYETLNASKMPPRRESELSARRGVLPYHPAPLRAAEGCNDAWWEWNMEWRCSSCGESVPVTFDLCWNCGVPLQGTSSQAPATRQEATSPDGDGGPRPIPQVRRWFRLALWCLTCAAIVDLLYHGLTRFSILVGIQLLFAPLLSILFVYLFGPPTNKTGSVCR